MSSLFGRSQQQSAPLPEPKKTRNFYIIVLGNEKGGSGKTTTGMHIMVALMRLGFKVGSIDIDARQRSMSRYIDNRRKTVDREGVALPMPHHIIVTRSPFNVMEEAEEDEHDRFNQALDRVAACDFVLIDSPGNDTYLSRLAHSYADTIITPINDSFVDLDVLASVDGATMQIIRPSIYSEMVWEQKLARAKRDGGSIEWIVMRNRLSHLDAKNKRFMKKVTDDLSRRIGFRMAPGFSERVIYREMFLQGLTVLDVIDMSNNNSISLSHVAAKQEVRDLLKMLRIPEVDRRINELKHRETEEEEEQKNAVASAQAEKKDQTAAKNELKKEEEAKAEPAAAQANPPAAKAEPAMATGTQPATPPASTNSAPITPKLEPEALKHAPAPTKPETAAAADELKAVSKEPPKSVALNETPKTADAPQAKEEAQSAPAAAQEKSAAHSDSGSNNIASVSYKASHAVH